MRRIPTFLATLIVATWLFMIGFAAGFEYELATDPTLTRDAPEAAHAGLTMGVSAVAAVLVIAASVRLTKSLVRARSREMHAAL